MKCPAYLVALVFSLVLFGSGCKTTQPDSKKPTNVSVPERKTSPLPAADEKILRERSNAFLKFFAEQNFDGMWSLVYEPSKQKIGQMTFTSRYNYKKSGSLVGMPSVDFVGQLEKNKALVRSVIPFQFLPTMFGSEIVRDNIIWENEWVKAEDGQWYWDFEDPKPDPQKQKELEEICGSIGN